MTMCHDSESKDTYCNVILELADFGISGLEKCPFPYKHDLILYHFY